MLYLQEILNSNALAEQLPERLDKLDKAINTMIDSFIQSLEDWRAKQKQHIREYMEL